MNAKALSCLTITILMILGAGNNSSLSNLILPQEYVANRATSARLDGANKDHIAIAPGQTTAIADLNGPGIIKHCWFTIGAEGSTYLSDLILKMTWDNASAPAVDAPVGPFFGLGHNECADVVSAPIAVMAAKADYIKYPPGRAAYNCYFPMPFHQSAKITITNTGKEETVIFFYHIDWQKHEKLPQQIRCFHATYRTEMTRPGQEPDGKNVTGRNNYVILDTKGKGHYVGCTLHVEAHEDEAGKWYEGDDMIIVDGQPLPEGILGTGSEDYFSMAWGVRRSFQAPYFGTSYHKWNIDEPEMHHWGRFSVYRWHIPDPIPFEESILVTIEHGHNNDAANRYASVAYFYLDHQWSDHKSH